jgi:hypothetical protein
MTRTWAILILRLRAQFAREVPLCEWFVRCWLNGLSHVSKETPVFNSMALRIHRLNKRRCVLLEVDCASPLQFQSLRGPTKTFGRSGRYENCILWPTPLPCASHCSIAVPVTSSAKLWTVLVSPVPDPSSGFPLSAIKQYLSLDDQHDHNIRLINSCLAILATTTSINEFSSRSYLW